MPECKCPNCGHEFEPKPVKNTATTEEWERFIKAWNEHVVNHTGLAAIRPHGTTLRDALGKRLKDLSKQCGGREEAWTVIGNAMRLIRSDAFYFRPSNGRTWVATASWLMETSKRLMELNDRWVASQGGSREQSAKQQSSRAVRLDG